MNHPKLMLMVSHNLINYYFIISSLYISIQVVTGVLLNPKLLLKLLKMMGPLMGFHLDAQLIPNIHHYFGLEQEMVPRNLDERISNDLLSMCH